ncbi:hypothetical protein FACS189463_2050 [Bacteroidia bacterium]|nr:hypothetical protein FACS189463_2050 [Bacteroidia bacterium]
MKKTVVILILCSLPYTLKAVNWIIHITSTDSIVSIFIDEPEEVALYRVHFDTFGILSWNKENDTTLCNKVEREYDKYLKCRFSGTCDSELEVYKKNDWSLATIDWNKIPLGLPMVTIYHTCNNGDVWLGGDYFLGCNHTGVFTTIFYKDKYEEDGITIDFCETDEGCPELELGYPDPTYICYCDDRKLGYIQSANGYVNFYKEPNVCSSSIGIILDKVRVFYWDDENSSDWYRVEINDVAGYVYKSQITPNRGCGCDDGRL